MKYLILLFSLLFSFGAQAQAPGFLGQRFFLEAGVSPTVQLYGGFDSEEDEVIVLSRSLSANYVIGRHSFLTLEYGHRGFIDPVVLFINSSVEDQEIPFRVTVSKYSIGYARMSHKRTKNRALAPLGKFFGYRLFTGKVKIAPDDSEGETLYQQRAYTPLDRSYYGGSFIYGYRTIFGEKVTFSTSLEYGTSFNLEGPTNDPDSNVPSDVNVLRHYGGHFIALKIGVGYLLF